MKRSRLKKVNEILEKTADDDFSSYSVNILVPDIQDKIVDKDSNGYTYGPGISREWLFEKDLDYPEWEMQK